MQHPKKTITDLLIKLNLSDSKIILPFKIHWKLYRGIILMINDDINFGTSVYLICISNFMAREIFIRPQ